MRAIKGIKNRWFSLTVLSDGEWSSVELHSRSFRLRLLCAGCPKAGICSVGFLLSQVEGSATGSQVRVAGSKKRSVPGTNSAEACRAQGVADLEGRPPHLLDLFAKPPPATCLSNEPLDILATLRATAVVAAPHHHHYARLFDPPGARPVLLQMKAVIDVEVEITARTQGTCQPAPLGPGRTFAAHDSPHRTRR